MILNQIIIPVMKLQLQRLNRTPLPKYLGLFWIVVHTFHFGGISPFTPLTALAQSPPCPPGGLKPAIKGIRLQLITAY